MNVKSTITTRVRIELDLDEGTALRLARAIGSKILWHTTDVEHELSELHAALCVHGSFDYSALDS